MSVPYLNKEEKIPFAEKQILLFPEDSVFCKKAFTLLSDLA